MLDRSVLSAAVTGAYYYAGGLVGSNAGYITQSYATGSRPPPRIQEAGLVGYNFGIVTQSYATAAVNGTDEVGGLVGS